MLTDDRFNRISMNGRAVLMNSYGTNCDRRKIYSFCKKLSDAKAVELLTTVNELTINIKKVIKNHCLHFERTTSDEHEFFARKLPQKEFDRMFLLDRRSNYDLCHGLINQQENYIEIHL